MVWTFHTCVTKAHDLCHGQPQLKRTVQKEVERVNCWVILKTTVDNSRDVFNSIFCFCRISLNKSPYVASGILQYCIQIYKCSVDGFARLPWQSPDRGGGGFVTIYFLTVLEAGSLRSRCLVTSFYLNYLFQGCIYKYSCSLMSWGSALQYIHFGRTHISPWHCPCPAFHCLKC